MHGAGSVPSNTTDSNSRRSRSGGPGRALPTGRALVGGLLVTLAAVVVFAAYAGAQDAPSTTVVVATPQPASPGSGSPQQTSSSEPSIWPPSSPGARSPTVEDLTGAVTLGPLGEGDLVQASAVRVDGARRCAGHRRAAVLLPDRPGPGPQRRHPAGGAGRAAGDLRVGRERRHQGPRPRRPGARGRRGGFGWHRFLGPARPDRRPRLGPHRSSTSPTPARSRC